LIGLDVVCIEPYLSKKKFINKNVMAAEKANIFMIVKVLSFEAD
jgi:hypothetical protein